ncbi:MAG TPA: GNAT family N-acetyltransferase [Bacteroidia bacterium]|nr:GNAT family N-acetyltransferase [Bacteroidia bacterium]
MAHSSPILNDDFEVISSPSENHFSYIKNWLSEEYKATRNGFYCNIEIIKDSFAKNTVLVLSYEGKGIGFVTWQESFEFSATIQILEIHPKFRRKKLGTMLLQKLLEFFPEKGIYAVSLNCISKVSISFCKNLGFIKIPSVIEPENDQEESSKMYKVLIEHAPILTNESSSNSEILEMTKDDVVYKWEIQFEPKSRKLKLPIIYPTNRYCNLVWKKENRIIQSENIQYFKPDVYFYTFAIILELPLL